MNTFSLFGNGPQVLLDDATGRIALTPALIDEATAQAWFRQLHEGQRMAMAPRISLAFRVRGDKA